MTKYRNHTDEELEDITQAFYNDEFTPYLGVFFTELGVDYYEGMSNSYLKLITKHHNPFIMFWVQWAKYKGKEIIYQCRDDWGLIYGSIEVEA